ncbi:MAG: hypothetical protein QOI28_1088 [Mycobacterium sp.]|jgi:hypothetical protein|nr:hypothetical protein [Mycobacterium sp.]
MSGEEGLFGVARKLAREAGEAFEEVEDAVEHVVSRVVGHDDDESEPYVYRPATEPTPTGSPQLPAEPSPHQPAGGCCGCCCRHHHEHQHHHEDQDQDDEDGGVLGRPGRPTRNPGHSRGELDGSPVTIGDIKAHHPKNSWPGVRKDMPLPFLFFRANPGDTGTRPAVGAFWESPDIYLLAGVHPSAAPAIPPKLGETALAGKPNTVYAHVWNFGRAAAHDVVVEFYWCNPTLGFNANSAHLIGRNHAHLGARGSGRAHHVVKCPEPWIPTFVNGGHECLLVRAWDNVGDLITTPEWDAAVNRHLGQRNVHVVAAAENASLADTPLTIAVGPLFGAPATVAVQREHPANVPWLQLHTGVRGKFPAPAAATGTVGLGLGGGAPAASHQVTGDGAQVTLHATDDPPAPGSAHVYRISANQGGATFGGYTVVVMG